MNNTQIIQETTKKLSKLVDKSRYSKNISYRLKNKRKGDFLTSREKVDFLLDINRIPTINKKFIDKAKDQINSGGNLTRIVICELNKRKYIADGQHRYIIGKAFNLPILVERYKVNEFKDILNFMKSINSNQNVWDNNQAIKFYSSEGGNKRQRANYGRIKKAREILGNDNPYPISNWFEVQAFFTYSDRVKSLEEIRGLSMVISRGFKDGYYKIDADMYKQCLDFIQEFRTNNIHEDFWRNAKVLRCIMRLFAINKNKMKIKRLIKQIKNNHNYIDTKREDTEIQQNIKAIYEKGYKRVSLVA
jgi:hypothetical protein|tara:strand:- start:53 stop:964 length:912 start_codon:yes stop_codon:yes gene_type:complete